MLTDQELIALEKDRQEDSDFVLKKIALVPILSKYGEVLIVGAKALGLMIAKDIDISVVVDKIDYNSWKNLVSELMTTPEVRKVTAIDYYNYDDNNKFNPASGKKESLYIQMDTLIGKNGQKFDTWDCQIHLIERTNFWAENVSKMKSKLTSEKRLQLLRIKYWANQVNKPLLLKTNGNFKIQSTSIYPLVLDGNVQTVDDFLRLYLPTVASDVRSQLDQAIKTTGF